MKQQKYENITLSFPTELTALLHVKIPRGGISKYVADAVRKALEEEEYRANKELEAAYAEAYKDKKRQKTIEEWKTLDDNENTEWEW